MPIPQTIFQTHNNEVIGAEHRLTWQQQNSSFAYQFFNDQQCLDFFTEHLPQLLPIYNKLPMPVQKADLFRYSHLYVFGGVYADTDTICHVPLTNYLDFNQDHLVVGIEMTPEIYTKGIERYNAEYCQPLQLLQWTIASAPQHPALKLLIETSAKNVNQMTSQQIAINSKQLKFTLNLTGPSIFTQTLLRFMNENPKHQITLLKQLCWGFNPWHNEHKQEIFNQMAVQHLYKGSWKVNTNATAQASHQKNQ